MYRFFMWLFLLITAAAFVLLLLFAAAQFAAIQLGDVGLVNEFTRLGWLAAAASAMGAIGFAMALAAARGEERANHG